MTKISQLPALDNALIDGTEQVPVVKAGATRRASLGALMSMFFRVVEDGERLIIFTDGSDDQIELGYFDADGSFVAHKYGGTVGNLVVRFGSDVDDGSGDLLQILDNTEDGVFLLRISANGTVYGKFDGVDPSALAAAVTNAANALAKANEALAKTSSGTKAQLLRDLAVRHQNDNAFVRPAMSSPPQITCGAFSSLPQGVSRVIAHSSPKLTFFGGELVDNGSSMGVSAVSYPAGGNLGNGKNALHWGCEFATDASVVVLRFAADPTSCFFRITVDGQHPTKLFTQMNAAGGNSHVTINFGSRAYRRVLIELVGNTRLQSVNIGATENVWRTSQNDIIRAAWIGDSFIEGLSNRNVAPFTPGQTWAHCAAAFLGWRNNRLCAIGGTGYQDPGTRWKFGDHATDWTGWAPDIVLFVGSVNDDGEDVTTTGNIAQALWQATRAALPNVPIVVVGLMTDASSANLTLIENTLKARFAAWADPNSLFVPVVTDPDGPWIDGTGNTNAPTGTGSADVYRTGGTHLNEVGDGYAGQRVAERLRSWLVTR